LGETLRGGEEEGGGECGGQEEVAKDGHVRSPGELCWEQAAMRDKSSAEGGGGERTNTEILPLRQAQGQNDERKVQQQIPYGNDKQ
jgi:hypothetical protein